MDTRTRILDSAERLQRTQGYAGWSYADVAAEIGIRKASIHHHFRTKGALLEALIARDRQRVAAWSAAGASRPASRQLEAFFQGYLGLLQSDGLCTCGALTVDLPLLPPGARDAAVAYVAAMRRWLTGILAAGQADGVLAATAPADIQADLVMSALQGGLQLARARRDPALLATVIDQLRTMLEVAP